MIVVEYMENGSLDSFLRVRLIEIWHTTLNIVHKQRVTTKSILQFASRCIVDVKCFWKFTCPAI